jgi:hypothetical protein
VSAPVAATVSTIRATIPAVNRADNPMPGSVLGAPRLSQSRLQISTGWTRREQRDDWLRPCPQSTALAIRPGDATT